MFSNCFSRRQLLQHSSLIAMAPSLPLFLRRAAHAADFTRNDRILVVLQLSGGNDGINTVVPYQDEEYAKHREKLKINKDRLLKLNDQVGLHPGLRPLDSLLEDNRLTILQGVGYPNPNRSHDVSMAIWQTARFDTEEHDSFGWIGRAMDGRPVPTDGAPHSVLLGSENPPVALRGRRSTSVALAHLNDLKLKSQDGLLAANVESSSAENDLLAFATRTALDAKSTADLLDEVTDKSTQSGQEYPNTGLSKRMESIAQLIKADFRTPVYYAMQPGYDTHSAQLPTHARLMRELAGAIKAFTDDLKSAGQLDRILLLCFSEFGRRVGENASLGTDHGTAGPLFLAGTPLRSNLIGKPVDLSDLEDGDLKMQLDFRQVYASVLEDWLGVDSQSAVGGRFEKVQLFGQA